MGLDAYVYCDCLENGRQYKPLPRDVSIEVHPDGYAVAVKNRQEIREDHPEWNDFDCAHPRRALLHHRLGKISLIGLLRAELNRDPDRFPIILQKVIYSGSHA